MECIDYAKTRTLWGQNIGQFQLIQLKLAEMEVARIDVQNMVFQTLEKAQAGRVPSLAEASAIKLYSSEAATEVAMEAVQLFGGDGYMVDQLSYLPVSRLPLNIMLNMLVSQQWLLAGLRPAADYLIARTTPVVPGVRVNRVSASVQGEWVWAPEANDAAGVVLVLHGSGYLICSSRTHRGFASHLSEYSGMPTFAIDYRFRRPKTMHSPPTVGCSRRDTIRRRSSSPATRPVGISRSHSLCGSARKGCPRRRRWCCSAR